MPTSFGFFIFSSATKKTFGTNAGTNKKIFYYNKYHGSVYQCWYQSASVTCHLNLE